MPDGRITAPTKIGELAKRTPRDLALSTARELERACGKAPLPDKPFNIQHLTSDRIAELRASGDESAKVTLAEYTGWQLAFSGAVAENVNRLRGVLWCWRALREAYAANNEDREAAELGALVRTFLREEWGVAHPPKERLACNELARVHVERMAGVENKREDV